MTHYVLWDQIVDVKLYFCPSELLKGQFIFAGYFLTVYIIFILGIGIFVLILWLKVLAV
jgi:hypothetical protein